MSKPRPNHARHLAVLRSMTSEQRLAKAFELTEMSRALFRQGLRRRFPGLSDERFHQLYLARLAACHNRNY
jgi:hypothetical protein